MDVFPGLHGFPQQLRTPDPRETHLGTTERFPMIRALRASRIKAALHRTHKKHFPPPSPLMKSRVEQARSYLTHLNTL